VSPASTYVQKIQRSLEASQPDSLLNDFAEAVGKQMRAPLRSKYSTEKASEVIKESYHRTVTRDIEKPFVELEPSDKGAILYSVMPDQPFIVDTIRLQLANMGATSVTGFNAVVAVKRDAQGGIVAIGTPSGYHEPLESVIRFEIEGLKGHDLEEASKNLRQRLRLAQVVVSDFKPMTDTVELALMRFSRRADRVPDQRETNKECADFLNWLIQDNFVFMGLHFGEQKHGMLRDEFSSHSKDMVQPSGFPLLVRKGSREAPLHRRGQMDEILVNVPDYQSDKSQLLHIQGLFTHRAVTQSSRQVPLLRQILAKILREDNCQPGTYRYKGICNVFDSLPTEFLFNSTPEQLGALIEKVLDAEQEQDARADVVQTERRDSAFVLAAIPQIRWSDQLRIELQKIMMRNTGASYCDYGVFIGRYNTLLVHFFLTGTKSLSLEDKVGIEKELMGMCIPWQTKLSSQLAMVVGGERGEQLAAKYAGAFLPTFQHRRPMSEAASDVLLLEEVDSGKSPLVKLLLRNEGNRAYLRVYQDENLLLSDMLPVIDDFGLRVVDQFADPVGAGGITHTIDTFRLEAIQGMDIEALSGVADLLCAGVESVFNHKAASDSLNRLILGTGLGWEAVDMFRAIYFYARQLELKLPLKQVQGILVSKPELVRQLWAFFNAKFSPGLSGSRAKAITKAREAANDSIRNLQGQVQDMVFRTFHNLIDSIERTNFYRKDRTEHYISFKIDCSKVHNMPGTRMMYEVYVHHRHMEGIHLRGGKIARGGIRWSDRSDFRREVLDLVTTQMIKNVVIVPEGAKGGFRMKEQISDRGQRRKRADELYRILIRGLLDLTDNLVDGEVVHPKDVVFHDGNDPYLVVAADKGTAHLSDTANSLSQSYGFWLGDAFASGGSQGYDHKIVGITARGAWMTSLRHFKEMGLDPEVSPYTAVGIGDPAGDVFGNGVTSLDQLTRPNRNMRLIGAFNHMHIFLDPEPDPEKSYQERLRLFQAVQGWGGYNPDCISKGGGVFSRSAKSISLSPEVQKLLGVLKDELPPEVVIRLLLRLDVDLLWNGGIGTYVKSASESHQEAGDPSNDILRIDASELRARIVGEGGNLGFTQKGRIEYALDSGRLNTDAIDNSGGVDMSDHEVNLKILLNPMVPEKLEMDERNQLLQDMTEEVAQDVLHNNDLNGRQLSLDQLRSTDDPMRFSCAIQWVCTQGGTTRSELNLPSDRELLDRQLSGQGLSRPELAVLTAHVKLHVFKRLANADHSGIPGFAERVLSYFPDRIQQRYPEEIKSHMLFGSIGSTVLLNDVVGDAGCWLFPGLMDITGASPGEIISTWLVALDTVGGAGLKQEIGEKCPDLNASYAAWLAVTQPLYSLLTFWLFSGEVPSSEEQKRIRLVLSKLGKLSGSAHRDRLNRRISELTALGVPKPLAKKISLIGEVLPAYEVAKGLDDEGDIKKGLVSYYSIGDASCILNTVRALVERKSSGGWDPAANSILASRFLQLQRRLVEHIDIGQESRLGIDRTTLRLNRHHLKELSSELEAILSDAPDLASLMVANARAQSRILKEFSGDSVLKGTGVV
jgi:glutamate dehydrogenase